MTKSMKQAAEVTALLKARNPLLWITSREESRVERYLFEAAAGANYVIRFWDAADGLTNINSEPVGGGSSKVGVDIGEALDIIKARSNGQTGIQGAPPADRCVWVLRDAPVWVSPPVGVVTCRALRNLARDLPGAPMAQAIIVLTAAGEVPVDLSNSTVALDWPLPDRDEMLEVLEAAVEVPASRFGRENVLPDEVKAAAIDAATGLTEEEANACFARSLVSEKAINPTMIAAEKQRVVTRERVLEWYQPLPGGFASVGGLQNVKEWTNKRKTAYSDEAREYGLPTPKGEVLVGVTGCGKTLIARATAADWNVPIVKLDLGALKSKFVGESEANLRKSFKVITALGRCIVLVDEIEKALSGATQGAADGGVSSDALGAFLTWMQDRENEAFVIATANDITKLPPELLRKGRFDEIWFVDIPLFEERVEVLKATLKKYGRRRIKVDHNLVAEACVDFTGAEVAAIVPEAMFTAFADGKREITTKDLLDHAEAVTPLVQSAGDKIADLRKWASANARFANKNVNTSRTTTTKERRRIVDL